MSQNNNSRASAKRRSRSIVAGVLATALLGGGVLGAGLPASAASGGSSVPGSGGTEGNVRPFGWMFDDYKADQTPVQGYDTASMNYFFANNPFAAAPDTSFTPNAFQAMQTACNVALDRADARKGGKPGTSRVVGMFWASSADPAVVWGSGVLNPSVFKGMYDGWTAAGYQGVLDAGDGVSDLGAYRGMIDSAMAEAVSEAQAAGNSSRAMCLALNESEPPMAYTLKITTDAANKFTVADGTAPVYDIIHASNGGSSITEKVNADVILHWTGQDGTTKKATKQVSILNNGDTRSPDFTPADFGWESWEGGKFWFDIQVAKQSKLAAAVDTPDRDPRESWEAWKPEPNKDVVGNADESGDKAHESINSLSVLPGQKLEYSVGVDLRVPAGVREKVKSLAVQDAFDAQFTPDKTSVEFWDSRDARNPKPVPRSAYTIAWDDAANSFTATFTEAWVKANVAGTTTQGWLTMRFTGTVKNTAAPGTVVKNQAFQIVNGVKVKTEIPTVKIPSIEPDKEDLSTDLVDIDKKTVVKGDTILYRLTMDGGPSRDELAYNVHKLGMVDDFDEKYVKVDTATIRVTAKGTGVDVTDQFNVQVKDGIAYVFAKTVDTTLPNGDKVPGNPQPKDLKAYDEAAIDPAKDPIINQDLLGTDYWITIPAEVTKATDGYVIKNQARENFQNTHKQTRIVSNPLKDIDPKKDVVVSPETGDKSINGTEIKLNSVFNYRLDSSEIPADRAYKATQWSVRDVFDRVHDSYTGVWAVHAGTDVYDGQKLVFKKGALLANSSGFKAAGYGNLFTVSFDAKAYTLKASATQAYLDLVNSRGDLAQAFTVYTKMERIAPAEKVENVITETYNNVDRDSNIVWTKTPERPAIDVEKFTLSEGMKAGDRDTAAAAYNIPKNELANGTRIGLRVTNTGDVPLKNVALTDQAHSGTAGKVSDITCTVGGTTVAGGKIGELAIGQAVDCTGTLTGVTAGKSHADTAKATGESKYSGKKVSDEDPWYAKAPAGGSLAQTGGTISGSLVLGAGILALFGGVLSLTTRRRNRAAALSEASSTDTE